ncbi:MAG: tRNA-dihydrouridine synthase, partial [Promethearchaeota archaeon]
CALPISCEAAQEISGKLLEIMQKDPVSCKLGYGQSYMVLRPKRDPLTFAEKGLLLQIYYKKQGKYNYPHLKGLVEKLEKSISEDPEKRSIVVQQILNSNDLTNPKIQDSLKTLTERILVKDILDEYLKAPPTDDITEKRFLGRAGGLGVQDRDVFLCIKEIQGSPTNIIGLPIDVIFRIFRHFNIRVKNYQPEKKYWPSQLEQEKIFDLDTQLLHTQNLRKDLISREIKKLEKQYDSSSEDNFEFILEFIKNSFQIMKKNYEIKAYDEVENHFKGFFSKIKNIEKALSNEIDAIKESLKTQIPPRNENQRKLLRLEKANCIIEYTNDVVNKELKKLYPPKPDISTQSVFSTRKFTRTLGKIINQFGNEIYEIPEIPIPERNRVEFRPDGKYNLFDNELSLNLLDNFDSDTKISTLERGLEHFTKVCAELSKSSGKLDAHRLEVKTKNSFSASDNTLIKNIFRKIAEYTLLDDDYNKGIELNNDIIYDQRDLFLYELEKLSKERTKNGQSLEIALTSGRRGCEGLLTLLAAFFFANKGYTVSLHVESGPNVDGDMTKEDIAFLLPYFNAIVGEYWTGIKKLEDLIPEKINLENTNDDMRELLTRMSDEQSDDSYDLIILTDERWYSFLVGTQEQIRPPFNKFKRTEIFTIHIHKNRLQTLPVPDWEFYTEIGHFIDPILTTGSIVFQLFKANAWHDPVTISYSSYKCHDFLKILENDQRLEDIKTFKKQLIKECKAFVGIPEPQEELEGPLISKDLESDHVSYKYKSPLKYVDIDIQKKRNEDDFSLSVTVVLNEFLRDVMELEGNPWPEIKIKIPNLIRSNILHLTQKGPDSHILTEEEKQLLKEKASIERELASCIEVVENKNATYLDVSLDVSKLPAERKRHLEKNYIYIKVIKDFGDESLLGKTCEYMQAEFIPKNDGNGKEYLHFIFKNDNFLRVQLQDIQILSKNSDTISPILGHVIELRMGANNSETSQPKMIQFQKKTLSRQIIRNKLVMGAPMHRFTDLEKRLIVLKDQKDFVLYTELIKIGNFYSEEFRINPFYEDEPNYSGGLPQMRLSNKEPYPVVQLSGPHTLPLLLTLDKNNTVFKDENNTLQNFMDAAILAQNNNAVAIDLNMGCPSQAVKDSGGGAELSQDNREFAIKLLETLKEKLHIPVSAKIRLVKKSGRINEVDKDKSKSFIEELAQKGADWIVVHMRTIDDSYSDPAKKDEFYEIIRSIRTINEKDFDFLEQKQFSLLLNELESRKIIKNHPDHNHQVLTKEGRKTIDNYLGDINEFFNFLKLEQIPKKDEIFEVLRRKSVPIFANGQISNSEEALRALEYGCDGVMIGTAAMKNEVKKCGGLDEKITKLFDVSQEYEAKLLFEELKQQGIICGIKGSWSSATFHKNIDIYEADLSKFFQN